MAKSRTFYSCIQCGGEAPKWQGQCPHCGVWNTLQEHIAPPTTGGFHGHHANHLEARDISQIPIQTLAEVDLQAAPRFSSTLSEFDQVLGGGLVPGAAILLGGDPGIGKSTLLLQVLAGLSQKGQRVFYVSGEESSNQVALRSVRLGLSAPDLIILPEIILENIEAMIIAQRPEVVVIDSIQTLYSEQQHSAPGSVSQVRECAARLTRLAKSWQCTMILVGHVTKDGSIAGPRVLEHIVDTVLYFEGDTHSSYRLIRAFKNRFGAINELGVFAMTERGLKGVSNPSALFLSQYDSNTPGACVLVTQEGSRPLLVEIQALVTQTYIPNPRRLSVGLEAARLAMLLAVLQRHAGVSCHDQDVFINAVGGVKISEPAADLAVLLSVLSSLRREALPGGLVIFGEIGLGGEIRPAPRGQERLREAVKLGFKRALIPQTNAPRETIEGLQIYGVSRVSEALEVIKKI